MTRQPETSEIGMEPKPTILIEEICRKLRAVVAEYGQESISMEAICVIGNSPAINAVGGHRYLYAPTISEETLIGVNFKIARFFEDA